MVWKACERQAIAIIENDSARYAGQTPVQVWESLVDPEQHLFRRDDRLVEPRHASLVFAAWSGPGGIQHNTVVSTLIIVEAALGVGLGVARTSMPQSVRAVLCAAIVVVFSGIVTFQPWTGSRRNPFVAAVTATCSAGVGSGAMAFSFTGNTLFWAAGTAALVLAFYRVAPTASFLVGSMTYAVLFLSIISEAGLTGIAAVAIAVVGAVMVFFFINESWESRTGGGGLVGYWNWYSEPLVEVRRLRSRRTGAEAWLDDRIGMAVTGALGAVLGKCARLPVPQSPRLVEVDQAGLVPTGAMEAVWRDLAEHRTAAVAVVGERGLGKTTVIEEVQKRCELVSRSVELNDKVARPGTVHAVRLIVPGDYSAPDFISYVAREVERAVTHQVGGIKPLVRREEMALLYGMLAFYIVFWGLYGVAHLSGRNTGSFGAAEDGFLVGLALLVVFVGSMLLRILVESARRRDARRRRQMLERRQRRARRAVLNAARSLRRDLVWLRRLSTGVAAELSAGSDEKSRRFFSFLPGGTLRAQRAEERTALTLTYAEVVRRTREVLGLYSTWAEAFRGAYTDLGDESIATAATTRLMLGDDQFSAFTSKHLRLEERLSAAALSPSSASENMVPSLVVMVDEMDKIPGGERVAAINHIKDLFRIPHVKFVVTIADNYDDYRFMRYGLPQRGRDPYDSAFDDIVRVRPCDPLTAMQLFTRRVRGFPAPLALLVFIVAAGHPRDMIRKARSVLDELRRAEADALSKGCSAHDARAQALERSIDVTCKREAAELTALLRWVEHPDELSVQPWGHDEPVAPGRPPGASESQWARQGAERRELSNDAEAIRSTMAGLMADTASYIKAYATAEGKGWATPNLVPGARRSIDEYDPEWLAYDDCREASVLASARLAVIADVRALAECRKTSGDDASRAIRRDLAGRIGEGRPPS